MNASEVFCHKAESYAKYRWHYSLDAIDFISQTSGLSSESNIADIGSGTGILTGEFVGKAKRVYAVEPNSEMREQAEEKLKRHESFISIAGRGEYTTLEDRSIDLVTAAHSLHWCEPKSTKQELKRILKPNGWFSVIRNIKLDTKLNDTWSEAMDSHGIDFSEKEKQEQSCDLDYYYQDRPSVITTSPFSLWHTLETWIGASITMAFAPNPSDNNFQDYLSAIHEVFHQCSHNEMIVMHGATEVRMGKLG